MIIPFGISLALALYHFCIIGVPFECRLICVGFIFIQLWAPFGMCQILQEGICLARGLDASEAEVYREGGLRWGGEGAVVWAWLGWGRLEWGGVRSKLFHN